MLKSTRFSIALCALLLASGCATVAEELARSEKSIIGGTAFSGLPAIGALMQDGSMYCSGTLIGPRKVLTAAHCIDGLDASTVSFAIGPDSTAPQAVIRVASMTMHPSYDAKAIKNDVGIVTLVADAPATPLGLLAQMDTSWAGRSLLFVGYGVTNGRTQTGDGHKRAVSIALASVSSTTFRYSDPKHDTCNGDSGGPALWQDPSGAYLVAGLTSYGDYYCQQYGVDTRVDAFLGFINSTGGATSTSAGGTSAGGTSTGGTSTGGTSTAVTEAEPNDARSTATPITAAGTATGKLGSASDVDYYKLSVPAGRTLSLQLIVPANKDYDLQLQSSTGAALATSQNDVGQAESISWKNTATSARVVYVKVYGYGGAYSATQAYQLPVAW